MPELRWILALAGIAVVVFVYLYSRRRSSGERADAVARVEPGFSGEPETAAPGTAGPEPGLPEPPADEDTLPSIRFAEDDQPDPLEGISARRDDPVSSASSLDTTPTPAPSASTGGPPDGFDIETAENAPEAGAVSVAEPAGEERVVAIRLKARRPEGFEGAKLVRAFAAADLEFGRFDIYHRKAAAGSPVFSVASIVEPGSFDLDALAETGCPGVTLFMVLPGPAEPVVALDDMLSVARGLAADLEGELLDERGVSLTAQREAHLREEIAEYVRREALSGSRGHPADVS